MNKYKLSIKGMNPDYFLKKLIFSGINIYSIRKNYRELIVIVDELGYKKIKKIKTSYKIEVIEVYGIGKIKEVFNKYLCFILFFCMGVCINIFLSKIILDIEVVHSNKYLKELVINELKKEGIQRFKFKLSFNEKERVISKILDKNKDTLEWLEIEEQGTKYLVYFQRRKKNKENDDCLYRDIVAKKNATILEINASSGEIVKKKYDFVNKGDLIVSGTIHNKENIMANKCAKGKVYGEVWYDVAVSLPINYHEEKITNNSFYDFEINYFNNSKLLFNKIDNYKKKTLFIIKNNILPISFQFNKYFEKEVIDKKFTLNNCSKEAIRIAEGRLKVKLNQDEKILSKKVLKKQIKKSRIIVEVFFKVKEDITDYRIKTKEELEYQKDGG